MHVCCATIWGMDQKDSDRSMHARGADIARVTAVLQLSESCYLPDFLSLRQVLIREAALAGTNLKFLALLEEPCTALGRAAPKAWTPAMKIVHPASQNERPAMCSAW